MKHTMYVTTEQWECLSHGLKGVLSPEAIARQLRPGMTAREAMAVFQGRAEHLCEYHQKRRPRREGAVDGDGSLFEV